MMSDDITAFSVEHEPDTRLVFLALDGTRLPREQRLILCSHEPDEEEWADGDAHRYARRYSGTGRAWREEA